MIRYFTISFSSEGARDIEGCSPRSLCFRSRENAARAAENFLREHAHRLINWPSDGSGLLRDRGEILVDAEGHGIYTNGSRIEQRIVPSTLQVEDREGAIIASAELEWRETRAFDKPVSVVVDGKTYSRNEWVHEVVRDWQPLCRRKYQPLGDTYERVRADVAAYSKSGRSSSRMEASS